MAENTHTPSRRAMLVSVGALAIAALPVPHAKASTLTGDDAALATAWREVVGYRQALDRVAWEGALYDEMIRPLDLAEMRIRETPAVTPRGAAIKLWLALLHTVEQTVEIRAVEARDLPALLRQDENLDWNARLIVSALRYLHTSAEG